MEGTEQVLGVYFGTCKGRDLIEPWIVIMLSILKDKVE